LIRVGELFREAIRANCASMIVLHNHPSGDPTPSPEDVAVTKQIVEAGKLLDVEVLDHLIIGRQQFVSLKEIWTAPSTPATSGRNWRDITGPRRYAAPVGATGSGSQPMWPATWPPCLSTNWGC
jgi:hypothetical protein